jgi:hypothetical protein
MTGHFDVDRLRNLIDTRQRISDKSHKYFRPYFDKNEASQRRLFLGAMDALLDATEAAASFQGAIGQNKWANLLACYGFLQALYVQQDAVSNVSKALRLTWTPYEEERLVYIRDLRNRLCGHPASAAKRTSSFVRNYTRTQYQSRKLRRGDILR